MKDLIALARMMNLYYHHLHNIAKGVSFNGDHELMNGFYTQLEISYDQLIERYIGLGNAMGKEDLLDIITQAHSAIDQIPSGSDMSNHFHHAMHIESIFRYEIEQACEAASKGTENLLAALADESEARTYKLNQRVE